MEQKDLLPFERQGEIVIQPQEGGIMNDDRILEMAAQAEKRIAAINKIMEAALKITTEYDWVLIGGRPYLQESGATKVASLFGISSKIEAIDKETRADGHYVYTYRMTFSRSGVTIEAEGARSSYDEFFTGKGEKAKSPDEIDVRDVKLAAYTNCMNNGIKRMIPGLRNISVDVLKDASFDMGAIRGYGFNSSSAKEESGESADKRGEIGKMLKEICGDDVDKMKAKFKELTAFDGKDGRHFDGYESLSQISEKAMNVVYGKVKKAYDERNKGNGGEA
jgi:hypothetical protein